MRHSQKHLGLFLALALALTCIQATAQSGKGQGLTTLCIDPGHGGKDPGCISRDKQKTKEKDIALGISLKVRDLIREKHPDVKVVMTRDKDTYPELKERATKANKAGADLFISIHVNSLDPKKNKNYASVSGFSVHTLGQSRTGRDLFNSNMELCKRENSVILLEDDYSTKYQGFEPGNPESYIIFNLMQNTNLQQSLGFAEHLERNLKKGPVSHSRGISQDPFLVLWMTTMPSVLLEVGFITNASDLQAMRSENGQQQIAEKIVDAFSAFKKDYDGSLHVSAPETAADCTPAVSADPLPADGTVLYGTQVLASSKKMLSDDKVFRGYTATAVVSGKLYKYIIGTSMDLSAAQESYKKIKNVFPDAFMVEVKAGEVTRLK